MRPRSCTLFQPSPEAQMNEVPDLRLELPETVSQDNPGLGTLLN